MESPLQQLGNFIPGTFEDKLATEVAQTVKKLWDLEGLNIIVEYPKKAEHGDYSCNIALQLSKQLGKSPREVGEEIKNAFPETDWIEKIEIAGPGFLNFFLSTSAFTASLKKIIEQGENYSMSDYGKNLPVSVEYSAPNIAKPLGVHHLLSTIIGQTIYNLYKHLGFDAMSVNHIGDWGTQFGKLIYAYKHWGDHDVIEQDPINELLKLYVHFHNEAEKDESLVEKGRAEFLKLEQGDEENRKLWEWICEVSMSDVQKNYDRLGGIHFDHTIGESFYEERMKPILEDGKKREVFLRGEKGAWLCFFKDEKYPPMMVQRGDGATLYAMRDLAQVQYRSSEWDITKNIIVVDQAQELHFSQYFETAKILGLNTTSKGYDTELIHVKFGRMSFGDRKMSTRKGDVILLWDVIDEAEKRALDLINERKSDLNDEEKKELAKQLGIGAIKYNILSQNRITNIVFEWDKCLNFNKNSAPYLQYTHARTRSILRKAKKENIEYTVEQIEKCDHVEEHEKVLLNLLNRFPQTILMSLNEHNPHLICNYLYDLAQGYNHFYNAQPILFGEDHNKIAFRIYLSEAVSDVIKIALKLLGIESPEKM